jgi:hypothetical protein
MASVRAPKERVAEDMTVGELVLTMIACCFLLCTCGAWIHQVSFEVNVIIIIAAFVTWLIVRHMPSPKN